MKLRTERLEIVAATYEHCLAESTDAARLGAMLGARVPGEWPPPLNDEDSQRFFLRLFREDPALGGWALWYFVSHDGAEPTVIGNGGFKGAPVDGTVEIGYSILPPYQRRGYAGEAVEALVRWAFEDWRVDRVIAETFPDLTPSIGLLAKTGFTRCEGANEPGAIRFERLRAPVERS